MPTDTYLMDLFESMPFGVLIADDLAVYVDVNSAACHLFSRRRSDIIRHHLSEFVGTRREAVNIQWDAFIRDGSQSGVFAVNLPNGSSRTFSFQARANFVHGLHCSLILPVPDPNEGSTDTVSTVTICAWSKRIRIGKEWLPIEEYLTKYHGLTVSHGIAPDVFKTVMGSWNIAGI